MTVGLVLLAVGGFFALGYALAALLDLIHEIRNPPDR